ncbi:TetR family transcriptional regulator [Natronosporangium hydrolyticum]|uniref:TetR family transcriptional regulator n=1 Tax=Natronosporangium hydrolyticum TaxID=2811111 RepID=A0A895YCX6_9ACTN|nr:TetR family transcriptional regulator [Natronosporangium hydrolyticum]QSB15371.1 TetR family transcriptional regulator [Natronosporangium hydrolyticum]
MRTNLERRTALLDAAIEVLARDGARGLTFRAVDAEAGTPVGTASNYFANRDDLLIQSSHRVYERWLPDQATQAAAAQGPRDQAKLTELMREIIERVTGFRSGYLAMLELRLEATRRPELRTVLTNRVRADVDANVAYHLDQGMPGDATSVRLLILALNWLMVEMLTLPELFTPEELDELVVAAVERGLAPR